MTSTLTSNLSADKLEKYRAFVASPESLRHEINLVFKEGFEVPEEKLKPESLLFTDLGLDSLDAVDMMVHLEEKLDLRVDGDQMKEIRTLGDVHNMIHATLKSHLPQ